MAKNLQCRTSLRQCRLSLRESSVFLPVSPSEKERSRISKFVHRSFIAAICIFAGPSIVTAQDSENDGVGEAPLASGEPRQSTPSNPPSLTSIALAPRQLADGVLTIVPAAQSSGETTTGPADLAIIAAHPEIEWSPPQFPDGQPNFMPRSQTLIELSREVTLRHPIWALEFAFKPVRQILARLPNQQGELEDKLVWYLLYRVRYTGGDLLPELTAVEAGTGIPNQPKAVRYESVRFLPRFILRAPEIDREYESQILSTAKGAIANRERVGKPLLDFMEMSSSPILPVTDEAENAVWGIATWTDLDPQIDAFQVDVKGLTNAYRLVVDTAGERDFERKTLRMNFWKPGDTVGLQEDRIYLGVPPYTDPDRQEHVLNLFKLDEPRNYTWIYR